MSSDLVRASLDLGDDGRPTRDIRFTDDPREELRPDDAFVDERLAARQLAGFIEERKARRGAASAGRTVDLTIRKDRDIALP